MTGYFLGKNLWVLICVFCFLDIHIYAEDNTQSELLVSAPKFVSITSSAHPICSSTTGTVDNFRVSVPNFLLQRNLDILEEDSQALENFFSFLFSGDLGYALIGEKPISVESFYEYQEFFSYEKRKKLCECLKKICVSPYIYLHTDKEYSEITLIHIPALKGLLSKKRKFFAQELPTVTLEDIMNTICQHDSLFNAFHSIPLGVLFGYGEENARFFWRRIELGRYLRKAPLVWIVPNDPKYGFSTHPLTIEETLYTCVCPKTNPDFSSLEEEWKWICHNEYQVDRLEGMPPFFFQLPSFVAKKGKKTDLLLKKYTQARNKLSAVFLKYGFLTGAYKIISDFEAS